MIWPVLMLPFAMLLLAASICDLAWRRIPNLIVLPLAALGAARSLFAGSSDLIGGLAASALVFALLWIPWRKGFVGGGDLKLAAATALWLEPTLLPGFLLTAALAGGLISLFVYAYSAAAERREVRRNLAAAILTADVGMLPAAREAGRTIPYAIAIAAGAMAAMAWRG